MTVEPRYVICVLHINQVDIQAVVSQHSDFEYDERYSLAKADGRMLNSFVTSADRMRPSFGDEDVAAIGLHKAVNYFLSSPLCENNCESVTKEVLRIIIECFEIGALAVKCESSGIAHGKQRWIGLCELSANGDQGLLPAMLAFVRFPLSSPDGSIASVGMHLIGLRDGRICNGISVPMHLDAFLAYQLRADGKLLIEGGIFQPDNSDVVYRLSLQQDKRYEQDDFFFNPYGLWCLTRIIEH
eukprot:TRINITY_DN8498_c0_g1_i1.p1 TRINITY_DN8498_c0_g1~~TRINITY_DN8498_c0_g1_i1.p1  ORF type:complete len:242 (+),score=17.67 TRINITY_DN8498_c0_g1_i1:2-727(+)